MAVDNHSAESDSLHKSTPGDVEERLWSMSKAEIDELIEALRGARSKLTPNEEETGQSPAQHQHEAVKSNRLGRSWSKLQAGAVGLALERDFWKSTFANVMPWALALFLAPIVVPWTFERDRAAAQARISIEYAFLSRHSQAIPNEVAELVTDWFGNSVYQTYRLSRQQRGPRLDVVTFVVPGARLGPKMYEGLKAETIEFRKYLDTLKEQVSQQSLALQSISDQELRSFAFDVLDDPSILDETNARRSLSEAIADKSKAVQKLSDELERLEQVIAEKAPEIRVRLTLLNRGATDGLVRHHGEIGYRGQTYSMTRAAPPSADVNRHAVPVFQTNAAPEEYSAGAVGKIEQDSMAEFWYAFRPAAEHDGASGNELCRPGETLDVTLYDQNRSEVQATMECNQE